MSDVTVTGGSNHASVDLGFSVTDRAYLSEVSVFDAITAGFSATASHEVGSNDGVGGTAEAIVRGATQVGTAQTLTGFGAIVIANTNGASTVHGGGGGAQTVVASGGGLTFGIAPSNGSDPTAITLAALGGDNSISYVGNISTTTTELGDGNDTVFAGSGATTVMAGGGANSIIGGSGKLNVRIEGTDTINLGSGAATLYLDPAGQVTPAGGTATVGASAVVENFKPSDVLQFTGVDNLPISISNGTITAGDPTVGNTVFLQGYTADPSTQITVFLSGTDSTDPITGGDDIITAPDAVNVEMRGSGGNDSMIAGSGSDYIEADGSDTIQLGSGQATVSVTGSGALIQGATSDPTLNAFGHSLQFQGGADASTVLGGLGSYFIEGGGGGGIFTGGSGGNNDIRETGSASATITGGGANDALTGGSGNDVISAGSGDGVEITGGGGADSFIAGAGHDTVNVDGIDTLQLGTGRSLVFVDLGGSALVQGSTSAPTGSTGADYYSLQFQGGAAASTVLGGLGRYRIDGGSGGGDFAGGASGGNYIFESGAASVVITGGGDGDALAGGGGSDTIFAGDGSSVNITGGGGNDSFVAGAGFDIVNVDGTDTLQLGTGLSQVFVTSVAGASAMVQGSTAAPSGTGYSLEFFGGTSTSAGASTVLGGLGRYRIDAGPGGGNFTGGASGANYIFETGSASVVITGAANGDALRGGSGNDTIFAGNGTGVNITGGGGHDSFVAGAGFDIINADGVDTLKLGTGLSQVFVSTVPASGASVLVQGTTIVPTAPGYSLEFYGSTNASTVLGGEGRYYIDARAGGGVFTGGNVGQNDIFGTGAMTITGGGYGDFLQSGNTGSNLIIAGIGRETMSAGAGNATLTGQAANPNDSTSIDFFNFDQIGSGPHSYVIDGFRVEDFLTVKNTNTIENYATVGGSGTVTLQDGTHITLQNYTGAITNTYTAS